jgi:LPS sulfotransferase NodH
MSNFSELELREINTGLQQIDDDFAELNEMFGSQGLNFSEESSEELSALDAALEGSGLEGGGSPTQLTFLAAADGEIDAQTFFAEQGIEPLWNPFGVIKRKGWKIIRWCIEKVRKYGKLKACVPTVTKAVILFKAKKYYSALKQAYKAVKCIKSHL